MSFSFIYVCCKLQLGKIYSIATTTNPKESAGNSMILTCLYLPLAWRNMQLTSFGLFLIYALIIAEGGIVIWWIILRMQLLLFSK